MMLTFQGGNQYCILTIDRHKKKLWVSSEKTNYHTQEMPYLFLFDQGKEAEQEHDTDLLNELQFKSVIVEAMKKQGYSLVKEDDKIRKPR